MLAAYATCDDYPHNALIAYSATTILYPTEGSLQVCEEHYGKDRPFVLQL